MSQYIINKALLHIAALFFLMKIVKRFHMADIFTTDLLLFKLNVCADWRRTENRDLNLIVVINITFKMIGRPFF